MTDADARALVDRYVAAYASGDATRLDDVLAPGFVDHTFPQFAGPDGAARAIASLHARYADVAIAIDDLIVAGDRLAFRATISATRDGAVVTWSVADFARVVDGRIAELWSVQPAPP